MYTYLSRDVNASGHQFDVNFLLRKVRTFPWQIFGLGDDFSDVIRRLNAHETAVGIRHEVARRPRNLIANGRDFLLANLFELRFAFFAILISVVDVAPDGDISAVLGVVVEQVLGLAESHWQ